MPVFYGIGTIQLVNKVLSKVRYQTEELNCQWRLTVEWSVGRVAVGHFVCDLGGQHLSYSCPDKNAHHNVLIINNGRFLISSIAVVSPGIEVCCHLCESVANH